MFGAVAHVHSSVPHSQVPYTWIWVAASALDGEAVSADSVVSTIAATTATVRYRPDTTDPPMRPSAGVARPNPKKHLPGHGLSHNIG